MIRVLFLSANPSDKQQLKVVEEFNDIDDKMRAARERDHFDLVQRHAVTINSLQQILLRFDPQILHFSGHGSEQGALIFQNSDGNAEEVPPEALTKLFGILGKNMKCVVLNACYAERQAEAISRYVDCVIGMSDEILDDTARSFAASFYQALGYGTNIKDAFELACNQLGLEKRPDELVPRLKYREGIDPSKVKLVSQN